MYIIFYMKYYLQISLRNSGKIRLIKLESASDDYAVISHDHYCTLICNILKRNVPLQHKVINTLLPGCVDVSISKIQLTQDMKFTSEEIRYFCVIYYSDYSAIKGIYDL